MILTLYEMQVTSFKNRVTEPTSYAHNRYVTNASVHSRTFNLLYAKYPYIMEFPQIYC